MTANDPINVKKTLKVGKSQVRYYSLKELAKKKGYKGVDKLPVSIKILLEAALRQIDDFQVSEKDVKFIAGWKKQPDESSEIPFKPARVVMQDFTGVPAVVDLAVMRDAIVERLGGDPTQINPVLDVDLVIDHSVQIDFYGAKDAFKKNVALEFERNKERYEFLKWGAETFANFRVVPPATGIVHQVNLEYLAPVVKTKIIEGEIVAYPDSLVGTDSHTTMINGLGVLGWGVGGIEAEAALLDQPLYMLLPEVVGFKLTGKLPEGATATDLVLRVTQMLRKHGVVGKFVEFYGPGLSKLSLPDRATIANMAPEYGATCGFFPVDKETLDYMKRTNRSKGTIDLVAAYCKAQGLFRTDNTPDPVFSSTLKLDLATVKPSLSGPKRPHDRFDLKDSKAEFAKAMADFTKDANRRKSKTITLDGKNVTLSDGSIVIAAITSCTNTSNPSVLMAAGLLAKKAVEKGLSVPAYVKTSLAPGSRVVTRYLEKAGLQKSLDKLGFNIVGYGCTTCIGNSGPLRPEISAGIQEADLVASAVLSGNRNFEGRIHADVKANYLASPPLVVAYALAGTMDIDLYKQPLGHDKKGKPVFLKDIWPSQKEIQNAVAKAITSKMYAEEYGVAFKGDAMWRAIKTPKGERYTWDEKSTYIRKPPYFDDLTAEQGKIGGIRGARCLAYLGDSVTTDHISPAGNISKKSPAAAWLMERGVQPADFNQYGARRGNHEVMMRGTFANIRIKNKLVPGVEGGVTRYLPTGEQLSIYDAAMKYKADGTPLLILAGAEYGSGSSRDWAAKGTFLQGVKAVIAKSYERIHRSNLIGMGVLPLQFKAGEDAASLGLTGEETFDIVGLDDNLKPQVELTVVARGASGEKRFTVLSRVDTAVEVEYLRNGGILHTVLKNMAKAARV